MGLLLLQVEALHSVLCIFPPEVPAPMTFFLLLSAAAAAVLGGGLGASVLVVAVTGSGPKIISKLCIEHIFRELW